MLRTYLKGYTLSSAVQCNLRSIYLYYLIIHNGSCQGSSSDMLNYACSEGNFTPVYAVRFLLHSPAYDFRKLHKNYP